MGLDRTIDITAEQRKIVLALLQRHLPNKTAWVYGSRAKWTSSPQSDLDLVVFATPEQNGRVSYLREALEESSLPFRVDLFVWDTVPEQFRKHIKRDHVVMVEREERDVVGEWRETVYGRFSSDFVEDCLVNLCDQINGIQTGPFGSQLHKKDYVSVGTPIITVEHLGDNRILHEDIPHVSDHDRERLSKYILHGGDIVFSRVGSVDRRALVKEPEIGWLFSGRCLRVRPDPNKTDSGYLSYFFGLPSFKEHIRAIAVGATMPSLNTQILSDIAVPHPRGLNEQRAIAHILGTLDDKIELNRRMNETLEAMARALFKSWFVDFDPVRATMAGRDPGLPKRLADLFPDRMVDSELGKIPEGWEAGALGDIAFSPRRSVNPASLDGETPYIGLEHMPRHSIALTEWENVGKVTSNKSIFEKGEVLFGKLRPYFHKVGIAPVDGVCSTDVVVIASKATEWSAFALACVSSVKFVSYTNQASTGTKMPRTSWKIMGDYRMCLPTAPVARAFQNVAHPVLEHIIANIHESRTLASLRDTLLPKLVSGEVRVKLNRNELC